MTAFVNLTDRLKSLCVADNDIFHALLVADLYPARGFQQAKEPEAMACGVKGGVSGRV